MLLRQERAALGVHVLVRVVRPIGAIHAGEDGLQAVVFRLRDRVELVIVTSRAVNAIASACKMRSVCR